MTCPIWAWVASLYCRQNSMMFTPCCPRAVPTGGAGVACPALICSLTTAETFLRRRDPCSAIRSPPAVQAARGLPPLSWYSYFTILSQSGLGDLVERQLDRRFPIE